MGVIVPEDEFQVSLIWTNALTAKEFTVTLGLAEVPLAGDHSATEVVNLMYGLLVDDDAPCDASYMATGWGFEGVTGFKQTSAGPVLASSLDRVGGSGGDNDVPVNCAVLMTKQTAVGGRKNRGRCFLPPYMAALVTDTDGSVSDNIEVVTASQYSALVPLLFVADLLLVIHHSDGSPGTPITGFSGSPLLATQRKRMR